MASFIGSIARNLKSYLLSAALIFYGVGFLIHNIYLSTFNISNYELIKGRYIFGGLSFCIIFLFSCFILQIGLSYSDPASNFKLNHLLISFFRFETLVILLYYYFPGRESPLIQYDIRLLGLRVISSENAEAFVAFIVYSLFMNFILEIAFKGEVPEDRHTKTSIVFIALLFVPANILFIWGLIFDALFQRLLLFLGMIYISTLLFLWGRAKRQALPFLQSRFFRERLDESKRRLEELVFICIALVPAILILVSLYSRQLYCRLPSNYGGAKPLYATIYVVDTKPMHVQIIDDTQSNLFVKLEKENKVFLINKSLINKVEIALK